MITLVLIGCTLICLFVIIFLGWRFGSRRYSLPCPVWMKWMLDPPSSRKVSARTQKTIEYLGVTPGMNILDAGCGPGRLTIPLAKITGPDGVVAAMDLQEGMIQSVQGRAVTNNLSNISYLQGGIGEGKLTENWFDRIVMVTVLGEIPGREAALKEIYLALKPGGILLLEETIRDPHFQTIKTVRRLAGNTGFIEKGLFGNRLSYTMLLEKPVIS